MAPQDPISPLCAQAIRFHQAGDLARAGPLYRRAVTQEPRAFLPRYLLGAMSFQAGRPAEALAHLDAALALRPDAEAFNIRGLVLDSLGRAQEALSSYDRALALKDG